MLDTRGGRRVVEVDANPAKTPTKNAPLSRSVLSTYEILSHEGLVVGVGTFLKRAQHLIQRETTRLLTGRVFLVSCQVPGNIRLGGY